MAKLLLVLLAVCLAPAIVSARFMNKRFEVRGAVYCDTCRCGFETDATEYLAGATVRIECHNKDTGKLTFTKECQTDASGHYKVDIDSDRGEEFCDAVLVKSANPNCAKPNLGRDKARVILTNNNGMTSIVRYANNMGFLRDTALPNCNQILAKYKLDEDEI